VALIRHVPRITYPKSLLLPILSIQLRKYSIQYHTLTKVKLWPSSAISINLSPEIKAIQLNSGNVSANSTGTYTKQLIVTPNYSIPYLPSLVRCHGTIAKKLIAITSSTLGK